MATRESVQKQIDDLQRQLDEYKPKSIDEQIEELQKRFREEEEEEEKKKRNETFIKEEKRLLCLIESQHSIIEFLSNSLESEEKKLKDLEEQLELLRDCKNMYN